MNKHRVRPLYRELAAAIEARRNCLKTPVNQFGLDIHEHTIETCQNLLPSGSGWDNGTTVGLDDSHANKLVLYGSYHHMNDVGMYDGWTDHTIVVTPSLASDFDLRISGRNRNDIKEYLHQEFDYALRLDVAYWLYIERFPQFQVESAWENEDCTSSQCYQAFYVQSAVPEFTRRFWNNLAAAQDYAADLMEQAFYAPKENS